MTHVVETRARLINGSSEVLLTRSGSFADYGEAFEYAVQDFEELLEYLFKLGDGSQEALEAFDEPAGGWRLEFRPPNFMPLVRGRELRWGSDATVESAVGTEDGYWEAVERMLTGLAKGFLIQYEHLAAFERMGVEDFSGGSSAYLRLQKAVADCEFDDYGELVKQLLAATGERLDRAWEHLLEAGERNS